MDAETGKFRLEDAGLMSYSHGAYYTQGDKLGTFGFSVKKKHQNSNYQPNQYSIMLTDTALFDLIAAEHRRQKDGIELIASENYVSDDVMRAMGHA